MKDPTKVYTRDEAISKYGPIDFASQNWPNQAHWLRMFEVPDWFPGWTVMNTGMRVKHILCNVDTVIPLSKALQAINSQGLGDLLTTFDGCFNIRMVRGTRSLFSAHSYGLAFDINAGSNVLGQTSGGFYDLPNFVKCWTDVGFGWGGNWIGRKDPQHFSWAGWES